MTPLTHLTDVLLKATGMEVIAANPKKLFAWVDSDFTDWKADEKGKATKKTNLSVYKLTKDATFKQIFPSPDDCCLTQAQIIEFCKTHKDYLSKWATFFLFKSHGEFFVANVNVNGRKPGAVVFRFSLDDVWYAEDGDHVVLPQTIGRLDTEPFDSSDALALIGEIEEKVAALRKLLT